MRAYRTTSHHELSQTANRSDNDEMIFVLPLLMVALQLSPIDAIPTAPPATTLPATPMTVVLSPDAVDVLRTSRPDTIVGRIRQSKLGQVIEGDRPLTWDDVKSIDFWKDTIKDFAVTILAFVPRFIGTFIFLIVFWLIYRAIRRVAVSSMKKSNVDSSIRDMLSTLIKWCVMGFGVVIACNQLGIPIVAMLTGVSIIGLAVGFAAQETLANFIAGIVIFLDKPFKIGDWILIEGMFGQVKRVSFRATRLLTLDGEVVVFPNTQVVSKQLSNHSTNPHNRVAISVGIAYKENITDARRIILELTSKDARLIRTPPPEVIVESLGDSAVNLKLRFWIDDESLEQKIVFEYNERVKNALDAANIQIPFPHMQLYLEKSDGLDTLSPRTNRPAA